MSWNIDMIREITEEEAKKLSLESECIKGHNVYFVDFDGGFGYSVLVYKNNHHIHYANDYQLHHYHETTEELKKIYISVIITADSKYTGRIICLKTCSGQENQKTTASVKTVLRS